MLEREEVGRGGVGEMEEMSCKREGKVGEVCVGKLALSWEGG